MREWRIPDVIVRSLAPLPRACSSRPPTDEWMRQVASFGHDVRARPLLRKGGARADELLALRQRYGAALNLDNEQMDALFLTVKGMASLLQSMHGWRPMRRREPEPAPGLPNVLLLATMGWRHRPGRGAWPSGKPSMRATCCWPACRM
jgi:hypothetical protein